MLIVMTLVTTCVKIHLYIKVIRTHIEILILITYSTIKIQIDKTLNGLTKGFTNVVKCKGSHDILKEM